MDDRKFQGLYMGTVEDNADPMKIGRLKVRVEAVYGDKGKISTKDLPWASFNGVDGGIDDRGLFSVPSKNSHVLVMFIEGDANKPVVMGTSHTHFKEEGSPIPPGEVANGYPNRHVWKWGGATIVIDDDENSFTIKNADGSYICVANQGITLMHKSGAYIHLNGNVTAYPKVDTPAISANSSSASHAPCLRGGGSSCKSPFVPKNASEGKPTFSYDEGSRTGWSGINGCTKKN